MPLSVREAMRGAGTSCGDLANGLALPRPLPIRQLFDAYHADVGFTQDIHIGGGEPLRGRRRVTIGRDGRIHWQGHMRATGFYSYGVRVESLFRFVTPAGAPVVLAHVAEGEVRGSNSPGNREWAWDEARLFTPFTDEWLAVRNGSLGGRVRFRRDGLGSFGDVLEFLGGLAAFGAAAGATGAQIFLFGEAADALDLQEFVLPGIVGIIAINGALYVAGPAMLIPVFVAGAGAVAATVRQRPLHSDEMFFANTVFAGRIDYSRIRLTDALGPTNRAFACLLPGGTILLNIGLGYQSPTTYTGKGRPGTENTRAPGKLLIHELTHAWQFQNAQVPAVAFCEAAFTAAESVGGDRSEYRYGSAGPAWSSFSTEAQASIVAGWFAGNRPVNGLPPGGNQGIYPPMDESGGNPYFRYIRDNIRLGNS